MKVFYDTQKNSRRQEGVVDIEKSWKSYTCFLADYVKKKKKCGPMPNVMAALPNTGDAVCSTPQCGCAVSSLPGREINPLKLAGCPKLTKRSQPLVGRSSPYCKDTWGRYCCLTSFFPIVDTCLSCEDIARHSCAMVPRWRFFASFLRPVFPASRVHAAHFRPAS